jgi:soluble lytic murein transglycosylase-like protein
LAEPTRAQRRLHRGWSRYIAGIEKPAPLFRPVYVRNRDGDVKVGGNQVSDNIHYLQVTGVQGALDVREADGMIHAAERMNLTRSISQHGARCILADCLCQQISQRRGLDTRQIASDNQVIRSVGPGQGGFEAGKGAQASAKISPALEAKGTILRGWSEQDRGSRGLLHHASHVRNQRRMRSKRKQRFVLAHARTAAPNEDESGRSHVRMVASESLGSGYNRKNKVRPLCFIVACGLLGSALLAGDNGLVKTAKPRSGPVSAPGIVSVVRVGPDGRLIRVLTTAPTARKPLVKAEPRAVATATSEMASPAPSVPSVEATPVPARSAQTIEALIEDASNRYQVDPLLVKSVMQVESNFNPAAVSPKGAQGLMQLIPATAQRFGVTDPFDSKQNIEGGVKYLRYLQNLFPSDLRLSLAAYNAGEGAVAKYGAVPPYRETVDYVQKVHQRYSNARGSSLSSPPILESQASSEEPLVRHIEQVIDSEGRLFLRTR